MKPYAFNELLVHVYYTQHTREQWARHESGHLQQRGHVSCDTGYEPIDPPITTDEMQSVARAAKFAFAKIIVARKKAEKAAVRDARRKAAAGGGS